MTQPAALPVYPWFLPLWQQWCTLAQQQRLGQGLLLTGLEGIGVAECAIALGRYLLCEHPQPDAQCGRCKGCLLLAANTHSDLLEVTPEEGSAVIKVDQIRAIGDFVANTAQQAGRKVVVISPAEALHTHAANALLKNWKNRWALPFLFWPVATLRACCPPLKAAAPSGICQHLPYKWPQNG